MLDEACHRSRVYIDQFVTVDSSFVMGCRFENQFTVVKDLMVVYSQHREWVMRYWHDEARKNTFAVFVLCFLRHTLFFFLVVISARIAKDQPRSCRELIVHAWYIRLNAYLRYGSGVM